MMDLVLLWLLAIYGFITLILTLLDKVKIKRECTLIYFAKDPLQVEGELRSLLLTPSMEKHYPAKIILIWENNEYKLAGKIKQEFPGIEVLEKSGSKSLLKTLEGENPIKTVTLGDVE